MKPESENLQTENLRIESVDQLTPPQTVKSQIPLSKEAQQTVITGRRAIRDILDRTDPRLIVITGPCSIHDPEAAMDYARRLAALNEKIKDRYLIIMRVYFEKPRTTVGWKGYINDPHLDHSYDMKYGLRSARRLMLDILDLGLPIATEFLDPIVPQYVGDLVSWAAIGARTIESQTHREMASGLSMPVGLKNATDGSVQRAVEALISSSSPHNFLGIDQEGHSSMIKTTGNSRVHLVLRGGGGKTNYREKEVADAAQKLRDANLPENIIIDCSHANSGKVASRQADVWKNLLEQRKKPSSPIVGAMLESFIEEGNQPITDHLKYGLSITDACISWETTEELLTI